MTTEREWDRAYAEASGDHRSYLEKYMSDKSPSPPAPDEDNRLVARLNAGIQVSGFGRVMVQEANDLMEDAASRITALKREIAKLRTFSQQATKSITGIAGGGSENFIRGPGAEIYLADVPYCEQKIRERITAAHDRTATAYARGFNDARVAAVAEARKHGDWAKAKRNDKSCLRDENLTHKFTGRYLGAHAVATAISALKPKDQGE